MTPPLVSVVVPLFNKRATIRRALAAIAAQSWRTLEVIVVDDGSNDGGGELAANFGDPRITVETQANAGPGAARNRGLGLARGELVTFLDADDEWEPDFLSSAVRCLAAHPECGAFTAGYRIAVHGRSFRGGRGEPAEGLSRLSRRASPGEAERCLADFHACSAVYRTAVARAHGGFFDRDRCTYGEDVWFWIRVRLHETLYRHPAPLGWYHMDASELGIGARRGGLPLEPAFTHAATLRRACPPEMTRPFGLWLGRHALRAGFLHERDGRADLSRWLLDAIPETRLWPAERLRLQAKLAFPQAWHAAAGLRAALRGHALGAR